MSPSFARVRLASREVFAIRNVSPFGRIVMPLPLVVWPHDDSLWAQLFVLPTGGYITEAYEDVLWHVRMINDKHHNHLENDVNSRQIKIKPFAMLTPIRVQKNITWFTNDFVMHVSFSFQLSVYILQLSVSSLSNNDLKYFVNVLRNEC
jgi:hypothetical protein